jgi:3-hydroxybutyryl-CoA dehydratase
MVNGRAPYILSKSLELTQDDINAYANASGDFNPIHVNVDFARRTSFGGTIAHGLLLVGTLSDLLSHHLGAAWYQSGELKIRFKGPARPGDSLTVTATRRDNADEASASVYDVLCVNQRHEIILDGQARVKVNTVDVHGR